MTRKSPFSWLAGLLPLVLLAACGSPKPENVLVVGMDLSYPPFETIDPSGRPAGISVELAEALGRHLGRPIRIENIPFTGLIPSLQTGKVDLILSSMTATEERRRSVAFSDPYVNIGLALLAGKNSDIHKPDDLDREGVTVAVRQGTTGEVWARANLRHAKILAVEKENSAVLEVIQGKADAFIYDQMSVWKHSQQHRDATRAVLQPLRTESWAVALRPADTELLEDVNGFLLTFRESGGFNELGDRYLREQKAAFAGAGIPFYF